MNFTTLDIEYSQNQVATIWMNRPEVFNAFDETLINELGAACTTLSQDANVRVVVLAGRGKHFSAGADLNWMKRTSQLSVEENKKDARLFADMLYAFSEMKKPTIARIQGAALGGGTGLAVACDIAVATEDAMFAMSEVKFGIIPAVISPYVLRAIGARQASRYFQTAERINAQKAYEIGLIHEVVPSADLDDTITKIVTALSGGGQQAQAAGKELIRAIHGRPIDEDTLDETARRISIQRATDEAKEGFSAFFEKRKPSWAKA